MLVFTLLTALSNAEASPTKGFRLGACAGAGSSCYFSQARLSYNHDQFGVTLGFGLLANLSISGQYYFSSADSNTRHFLTASYAPVAAPLVGIKLVELGEGEAKIDPGFSGGWGSNCFGVSYGADFHFLKSRKLILTPRIGLDYAAYLDSPNFEGIQASLTTDLAWAF